MVGPSDCKKDPRGAACRAWRATKAGLFGASIIMIGLVIIQI